MINPCFLHCNSQCFAVVHTFELKWWGKTQAFSAVHVPKRHQLRFVFTTWQPFYSSICAIPKLNHSLSVFCILVENKRWCRASKAVHFLAHLRYVLFLQISDGSLLCACWTRCIFILSCLKYSASVTDRPWWQTNQHQRPPQSQNSKTV